MLNFDAEKHEYTWDGVPVPSVTTIMSSAKAYGNETNNWNAFVRDRGTAIHSAIELMLEDDLDETSIDPEAQPYVDQFKRFMEEAQPKEVVSECRVISLKHWYAGTFDISCKLGRRRVLIDMKTGGVTKTVGMQIAAYEMAAREMKMPWHSARYVLHLQADRYRLREIKTTLADDFSRFLACVERANVQRRERSCARAGTLSRPAGAGDSD